MMNKSDGSANDKDSPVGYGNPPRHTRFKKGVSGNARGRRKGTLNVTTVLQRALQETVVIRRGGKAKRVSKLQAAFQQVADKAASGDLKAAQLLAGWARSAEGREEQPSVATPDFDESDQKVLLSIVKRLEAISKEGDLPK
jgi:Family of unknown function (DUF5681)